MTTTWPRGVDQLRSMRAAVVKNKKCLLMSPPADMIQKVLPPHCKDLGIRPCLVLTIVVEPPALIQETPRILGPANHAKRHLVCSGCIGSYIQRDSILGLHELGSSCSLGIICTDKAAVGQTLKEKSRLIHIVDVVFIILRNLLLNFLDFWLNSIDIHSACFAIECL